MTGNSRKVPKVANCLGNGEKFNYRRAPVDFPGWASLTLDWWGKLEPWYVGRHTEHNAGQGTHLCPNSNEWTPPFHTKLSFACALKWLRERCCCSAGSVQDVSWDAILAKVTSCWQALLPGGQKICHHTVYEKTEEHLFWSVPDGVTCPEVVWITQNWHFQPLFKLKLCVGAVKRHYSECQVTKQHSSLWWGQNAWLCMVRL